MENNEYGVNVRKDDLDSCYPGVSTGASVVKF